MSGPECPAPALAETGLCERGLAPQFLAAMANAIAAVFGIAGDLERGRGHGRFSGPKATKAAAAANNFVHKPWYSPGLRSQQTQANAAFGDAEVG